MHKLGFYFPAHTSNRLRKLESFGEILTAINSRSPSGEQGNNNVGEDMLQADFKCTVSLDSVHIVDKLGIINETVVDRQTDRHTEFIVDG